MEKKFDPVVVVDICGFLLIFIVLYGFSILLNNSLQNEAKLVKDGVSITIITNGSVKSSVFDWTDFKKVYATSVKEAVRAYPFDAIFSDPAAITAYADSVFYKKTGVKVSSSSIEFSLPEDVEKAIMAKKIAELELQALQYQITKDSLISVAAKNDAHGYTPTAE